jgi:hypothetical protein
VMPSLAKALRRCVFTVFRGEVQLLRDGAVGCAFGDQMDDREFGIGEAVPARSCPRVRDDAPLHA